jgi:transposase|tara:strand:+ start:243 stop:1445 length:1203 start_codon:yes stop_codon:yes gene_type:complete
MTPLEDHLRQSGIRAPLVVAELLDAQDWTPFEDRYATTGRAPYAPRAMMGLILYGIMQGVSSLRALERLARVDLGAMWVTGGIAPDHANIGRFICLHEQALSQTFFEALTRTVLARSGTSTACLAGDGTVIEAACSHYRLLKEEAVRARVSKARIGHQQALPEQQDETQQQLDRAHACEQVLDARIAARRRHGKRTDTVRVSLLCPPRPSTTDKAKGLYHKNLFTYDAEQDVYYCPAGQRLQRISHINASVRSREQTVYACNACEGCPQRIACTRSVRGRRIKHYPEDEARLALQQIMTHPGAQAVFRQRKAMVEPVFSALRQQQGLSRFRRRGLAGVKREFSLHALAYNLARAVALSLCHHLWEWLWGCLGLPYLATKKKIAPPRACVMMSSSHRHRCV